VEVTQKGREARSETAVYDDKNETLTLTGNVHMKKAKEWISAGKVIVSVRDETFEALGSAEAQFKL
jgi:lipopolysaccharide export system protein LptA